MRVSFVERKCARCLLVFGVDLFEFGDFLHENLLHGLKETLQVRLEFAVAVLVHNARIAFFQSLEKHAA